MRKTFVVAVREYLAAVKTKAFIISLVALPLLMSGGPLLQKLSSSVGDTTERKLAVVDRTDGQGLVDGLEIAAKYRNETKIFDPKTGRQTEPKFDVIRVAPSAHTSEAVARQRFELSQQVRDQKIFAFLEIGRDVLTPHPDASTKPAAEQGDDLIIRYSSASPTYLAVRNWAQLQLATSVTSRRFQNSGVSQELVKTLIVPPSLFPTSLYERDANGVISTPQTQDTTVVAFVLPIALAILLYIVILIGASPMAMNVIEEKQLRIAEVLLGSLRPFELMMGKLLGGVGVALTLGALYLGGAIVLAARMGYLQYVPISVLLWFILFLILGVLMYGSMFVAVGAAASNMKEAQALVFPVIIVIVMPMMILGNLIQYPNGPLGVAFSFFPLSAPIVTITRLAVPPGLPVWQPIVSAGVAIVTTIGMIFAAGRIFRVGILMQGQGAKIGEILKWVVRG